MSATVPVPIDRQALSRPAPLARLVEYRPWPLPNASLVGHATIDFNGWIVARIPIFRRSDGALSAGAPSAPDVDGEGHQRERDGKRQYWSVISFAGGDAKQRWERAVLGAVAAGGVAP